MSQVMKPRMEASLGPCNWDTTGLSVHKTEVWLAASFDAECSHGVLELKVTAALAHTWFENGNNGAIPELPWGLNKQPKCAQPWEVFDPISNSFVQCPKEWVTKGVGPAKFSHFIQMMIQTCIARSLGKSYEFVYYGVWHPGRSWLFRTSYLITWTEEILLPFLRLCYWKEFYSAALDSQSSNARDVLENTSPAPDSTSRYTEATVLPLHNGEDDRDSDCGCDEDPDLKGPAEVVVSESPNKDSGQYNRPTLLSPGGLHDIQSDLKALSNCFTSELFVLIEKSGCNKFAAKTVERINFLLGVGSINKTWAYYLQVMVGFLLFTTRCFSKNHSQLFQKYTYMKWLLSICSHCPALERLRLLVRGIACSWFKKSRAKVGGFYLEQHFMQQQMTPFKAASGQDTYSDMHIFETTQQMTASEKSLVAILLGSEVHCGSHVKQSDANVEGWHEQCDRMLPTSRLTKDKWLAQLVELSATASSLDGDLNKLGTECATETRTSFGDIDLSGGGHEEVAIFFEKIFPNLPCAAQIETGESFEWIDTKGSIHNADDACDITGRSLSLPAQDPIRSGTMVFMDHLRVSAFGQINEQGVVDGDISPADVDHESYSFTAAFGTSRRLERVLESPAAQEKRELQDASIERARRSKDILAAYETSKKINQMRKRLKAFQMSTKRPEGTKSDLFDIDADHASRSDVSQCLEKWLDQEASYCIEIDFEIGVGANGQSKKSELVEKKILRCPMTITRDVKACDQLRTRGLLNDDREAPDDNAPGDAIKDETKSSQVQSEVFLTWLEDASKHKGVSCGGGKGCMLTSSFDGLADASHELVSVLLQLKNRPGGGGKKKQMSEFYHRQDEGVIKFLEFRKRRNSMSLEKGESFWSGAVPPAGAGQQCFERAQEFIVTKNMGASSSKTNARRAGVANKTKRSAVPGDPSTWTSSFLRKFLREKGKRSTGSRSELEAWSKDLDRAPKARVRTTKSPLLKYTVQRLRAELSARSLSTYGRKDELIDRLEKIEKETNTEAALLQSSGLQMK